MEILNTINEQNELGQTALMLASSGERACHLGTVEMLLKAEIRYGSCRGVGIRDHHGNIALHYALKNISTVSPDIAERKAQIAKKLIFMHSDTFLENNAGVRPLDYVTSIIARKYGLPYTLLGNPNVGGLASLTYK